LIHKINIVPFKMSVFKDSMLPFYVMIFLLSRYVIEIDIRMINSDIFALKKQIYNNL